MERQINPSQSEYTHRNKVWIEVEANSEWKWNWSQSKIDLDDAFEYIEHNEFHVDAAVAAVSAYKPV